MQIKCQYCGGTFTVPTLIGGETYRCVSHPERVAIGRCNDCDENYCGACLHYYYLKTDRVSATLHLCPNCLRTRHVEKANKVIYSSVLMFVLGVLVATTSIPFGILFWLIGAGAIIYGYFGGRATPKELTIDDVQADKDVDTEELYNRLLRQYVEHWGAASGYEILDNDITAYTMRGVSFKEAVEKVYRRQEKKSS